MTTKKAAVKRATAKARAAPKREASAAAVLRLEPSLMDGLDEWVERLNKDNAGPKWTRSDVIRATLTRALRERAAKGESP